MPCVLKNDKRLEDGWMNSQEMPFDSNLRYMMCQLNQDIDTFKNLYDRDVGDILSLVKKLETTADGLERVYFGTSVGSLTGGVVGAVGGVTSLVGLILAPFTLGISLIATGVGIGVAVAGGAICAISKVTNMVNQSMDRKTIEETISEYRDKMEPIFMSVEDNIRGIHTVKEHESYTNVANMAQAAFRAGRGLGGIAELVRLTQVALNVCFIAKDAKEIHSVRQGSQQQDEIESATMKLVANIREMVSSFNEKLGELECIRAKLETVDQTWRESNMQAMSSPHNH